MIPAMASGPIMTDDEFFEMFFGILPEAPPTQSKSALPENVVAIALDLETTGFSVRTEEVIEIGCVVWMLGEANSKDEKYLFSSRVRPRKRSVSKHATKVNNITQSEALKAPRLEVVAEDLRNFVSETVKLFSAATKPPTLLIAHNGNRFDFPMLERNLKELGLGDMRSLFGHTHTLDTLEVSKTLQKDLDRPNNTQAGLYSLLGITSSEAVNDHSAAGDALGLSQIVSELYARNQLLPLGGAAFEI